MKNRIIIIFLMMMFSISAIALASTTTSSNATLNAWKVVLPSVLGNIKPPTFPDHDFYITDFGATGNGITNCSQAFEKAIKACNACGGGEVLFPAG